MPLGLRSLVRRPNAPRVRRDATRRLQVLKWFAAEYPNLKLRPFEVIQEPGDIVWVPAGWGHAVLNLEPSVAVAFELGFPCLNAEGGTHKWMVVDRP